MNCQFFGYLLESKCWDRAASGRAVSHLMIRLLFAWRVSLC